MNYRIQIMCSIQIQKVKMKSVVQMINTIQMMMIQLLVFFNENGEEVENTMHDNTENTISDNNEDEKGRQHY